MYCRKCGAYCSDNSAYCGKCGAPLSNGAKNKSPAKHAKSMKSARRRKKHTAKNALLIIGGIILLTVIFVAAVYIGFAKMSEGESPFKEREESIGYTQAPEPTQAPVYTSSPSATAKPVPTQTVSPGVSPAPSEKADKYKISANPTYFTYTDTEFNFICGYPSDFIEYSDNDNSHRYTLREENGTAYMIIGAEHNDSGITPLEHMNSFADEIGGKVISESISGVGYTVLVLDDDTYYYRRCVAGSDDIIWFDFIYDSHYSDIYEDYTRKLSGTLQLK